MADDDYAPPTRLMNFVSQQELEEAKRNRGARVDDGTAQRERPLYEILKENKDKRDAEFNERFKHRPPKALDEDETEFLDKLEMSRRAYERNMADEEAQEVHNFKAAVAAQSTIVREHKEIPSVPEVQEPKLVVKKNPLTRPSGVLIKVKPQVKKAKIDLENSGESLNVATIRAVVKEPSDDAEKPQERVNIPNGSRVEPNNRPGTGLVLYSDESEDD